MATTTPSGVRGSHAEHSGAPADAPMTHRQIMEALSGLLLGMFVAILSSTIVANALPRIIGDLGGGQSAYTWVVTASLLSMTATTPLWGKLADLFSKKLLVQIALLLFVAGSVVAGLAQNPGMLIACRVVQGIGGGGLGALVQIVMAAMIAPRERGRYSGYIGATFAVATVGGPLLGGVITDTEWLGWRWCFYVGVPFAVIALIVLQRTLRLPLVKQDVKVDWGGAFSITAAVCLLLIWVTFAGDKYDWISWQTYAMVGGAVVLGLLFVLIETKAREPIIPLRLFRNSTIALTSLGSLFVGVAMFVGTVFFSQYFQLARGESPTMSGVMTIPMIGGLFVSSTVSGQIITRTGRWKAWLVSGMLLLTAGLGLLGQIRYDTPFWHTAIFMGMMGLGIGMSMQNLVLAVQNQVAPEDLGAASSAVSFFRSLGGAIGVSALGAVMASRITDYMKDGFSQLGIQPPTGQSSKSALPDLAQLPPAVREVVEDAYGHGIADAFLMSAPLALIAFLLVLFIKEVPLRTKVGSAQDGEPGGSTGAEDEQLASGAAVPDAENADPRATAAAELSGPVGEQQELPRLPRRERVPSWAGVAAASEETYGRQRVSASASAAPQDAGLGGGSGCTVHGFVRGAEGKPVARAAVTLISMGGRQLGRAMAHIDGGYQIDVPEPGSYVLIASADGYQPQASTVQVGHEPMAFDILLSGTSGLSGVVRQAESGEPVPDAVVIVTDSRGDVLATGNTGPQGEFTFAELVPGSVTVAVNAPHRRPTALPVEIGGTGVTRIEVPLSSGASVSGVIRAAGAPLNGARVTLVDAAGNVMATATTGHDGAYAFADLDDGEYTVIATGYPPQASGVQVSGRGVEHHDVELSHPED